MNIIHEPGLSYDDVLLTPKFSDIDSRSKVSLNTRFSKNILIRNPLVSANMESVTDYFFARQMNSYGGLGILYRQFDSLEKRLEWALRAIQSSTQIGISIGLDDDINKIFKWCSKNRINDEKGDCRNSMYCFVLDVAHAHQKQVLKRTEELLDFLGCDLIVGNVCTPEAVENLCRLGVSGIKVGVGNGSCCSTRIATGCGIPQLSALIECCNACDPDVPICADGGIRNSGDIVKALAAGASTVMIGRLFAECEESAGWYKTKDPIINIMKDYRGSSTFSSDRTPEGIIVRMYKDKGIKIKDRVKELCDGIQSGMSYCNSRNIKELQKNANFRVVSVHSLKESQPTY